MAEVSVPHQDAEVLAIPSFCAKSGLPAQDRMTMRLSHAPDWVWILILFGLFPFIIAYHLTKTTVDIHLPVSDQVGQQRSRFRSWMAVAIVVSVIGMVASAFMMESGWSVISVVALVASVLIAQVGGWRLWITARFDGERILLTRVHPNYASVIGGSFGGPR